MRMFSTLNKNALSLRQLPFSLEVKKVSLDSSWTNTITTHIRITVQCNTCTDSRNILQTRSLHLRSSATIDFNSSVQKKIIFCTKAHVMF